MDAKLTTEERARLVYEHLKNLKTNDKIIEDDLVEFVMGGISACCAILDIKNPYTGHKYDGDFTEMLK